MKSNVGMQRLAAVWLLVAGFVMVRQVAAQTKGVTASDSTSEPEQRASSARLLNDYVRLALSKAPMLAALRAKEAAAREMVEPAGALPDPMVGLMYQSMGPPWAPMPPMSMVQGEISQGIPGAGKRQARRDAATAEANLRGAEVHANQSRIVAEVRSLYAQIYALDREQQAVKDATGLLELMAATLAGQMASGTIDQEAHAKAEYERSKLRETTLDLQANRQILVAKLNRALSRPQTATVPRLEALPDVRLDPDLSTEREAHGNAPLGGAESSSELRVRRAAIAAANRKRESAETETSPNYLLGLAGGATTTGEPVITLRFAMELPLWRSTKQLPMVRAARKDAEAAESEYQAMELQLRGEISELRTRFQRDTEQIQLYREAIIPNAALTLTSARAAYTAGRGDFATVVEDFRMWLDAEVGLARREADRLMTWAELNAITEHAP